MSQQKKKSNFLKREVKFCGKTVVLYSIDGNTWSTRKEELQAIIDRHEAEKITFGEIKGGLGAGAKPVAAKKDEVDDKVLKVKPEAEDDEEIDDLNMIVEDDLDIIDEEVDDAEEEGSKPAGKRGRPSIPVTKGIAAAKSAPASAKLKSVQKSATAPATKGKVAKSAPKKKEAGKAKVAAPKTRVSGVPAKSKSKPKSKKAAA